MRRSQIRRATQRATSTALRLLDVALCRALAHRLEHAARHNPAVIAGMDDLANGRVTQRQRHTVTYRTTLDLSKLTPEQVVKEMRRHGWGGR